MPAAFVIIRVSGWRLLIIVSESELNSILATAHMKTLGSNQVFIGFSCPLPRSGGEKEPSNLVWGGGLLCGLEEFCEFSAR